MASLPENQVYNTYNSAVKNTSNFAAKLGSTLPINKKFGGSPSDYSNLVGMVGGYQNRKVPTSLSKLGNVTTNYGTSTKYEQFHPGVDVANSIGTPVPTFVSGKVTDKSTGHKQGDSGFGNYVVVTDENGNQHRYSHLNQVFVPVGAQVGQGQEIGTMGNTGQTYSLSGGTGSHLDYRIKDIYGKYINPYNYLKG